MTVVRGRKGPWQVVRNLMSLLTSDVVNRATSFVVYAAVARYLGALELGQLLLAVSLFQLFSRFSGLGLLDLVTREIASDRDQTGRYLGNASLLIVASTAMASVAILALVALLDYSSDTATVILLLFLGLLPYGISRITEAVFIAWERTRYIAWVNIPINLVQTGGALLLLASGYSVVFVAASIVVANVAMAVGQWITLVRVIEPDGYHIDLAFTRQLLRSAAPFYGMQATTAVTASINIVLLSMLVGELGVGVYSAAAQLLVPLALVTEAAASVIYPTMVRKSKLGLPSLKQVCEQATEFTIAFIIPAVIIFATFGGVLLAAVYGGDAEFDESVRVLHIIVWSQLGLGITGVFARTLMTSGAERTLLRIVLVTAGFQLAASSLLIWQFGVVGAAVSVVAVAAVNLIIQYVPVARLLGGFPLMPIVWRPGISALAMAIFLFFTSNQPDIARLLGASLVYGVALIGLLVMSPGRIEYPWMQRV